MDAFLLERKHTWEADISEIKENLFSLGKSENWLFIVITFSVKKLVKLSAESFMAEGGEENWVMFLKGRIVSECQCWR